MADRADAQCVLEFQDWKEIPGIEDPLRHDISAVAVDGAAMFVACDETATVEELELTAPGHYSNHRNFPLGRVFDLPGGPGGEMDIEGLDVDGGFLWITGSHALKRERAKRDKRGTAESLERMMEIERDPNRYFIGRVPIAAENGVPRLARRAGKRRPASVKLKKNKPKLIEWLKDDPHLAPFMAIPSKENGFDVEGIAARGSRVWLGLRGPVLRGYAVVLELDFEWKGSGRLKARRIDGKRRYRKHLIDTAGLGIRDMCFDGADMLLLTGTPLASDGPSRVLRWRNALSDTRSGVVDPSRIGHLLKIPYKGKVDHPEGMAILPLSQCGGRRRLVIVYDSPEPSRVGSDPARLSADVYELPEEGEAVPDRNVVSLRP